MKRIQVLGPGCPKCTQRAHNAQTAVEQLELDGRVEKVTDIVEITAFGVITTPALVIDGEVRVVGKVSSTEEIKQLLS